MENLNRSSIIERQFNAFVKKVLTNRHYDYINRQKRMNESIIEIPLDSVTSEQRLKEDMFPSFQLCIDGYYIPILDETLYLSLESLDMRKKRIVVYYYFLGFSLSEIGAILDLKKESVKVYKSKAIRELREKYESFL